MKFKCPQPSSGFIFCLRNTANFNSCISARASHSLGCAQVNDGYYDEQCRFIASPGRPSPFSGLSDLCFASKAIFAYTRISSENSASHYIVPKDHPIAVEGNRRLPFVAQTPSWTPVQPVVSLNAFLASAAG